LSIFRSISNAIVSLWFKKDINETKIIPRNTSTQYYLLAVRALKKSSCGPKEFAKFSRSGVNQMMILKQKLLKNLWQI
jgi:hypothetical protein